MAPVLLAAGAGGWWGTHLGHGHTTVFAGLRVVTADAQTVPSPITAQDALTIVENKLTEMEPTIPWGITVPSANVQEFFLTQVADNSTGTVLYQRATAIRAWVVRLSASGGKVTALGIVSDNTLAGTQCGRTGVCDPPGTILSVQYQTRP